MDGNRFDSLVMAFGSGLPRRRVLKLLAGGVAGGLIPLLGRQVDTRAQVCAEVGDSCVVLACCSGDCTTDLVCCAQTSQHCSTNEECCEWDLTGGVRGNYCNLPGTNDSACLVCNGPGQPCASNDQCCDAEATCVSDGNGGFVCSQACAELGTVCADDEDCCPGLDCLPANGGGTRCGEPEATCAGEGEACAIDADCCEGICCAGFCRAIECCIDEADPNARCPEGTSCFEGVCDPVQCEGVGGICGDDSDCCGQLICADGYCDKARDGGDDTGETVKLPTTGVGGDGGTSGLIAGAAIAAGAAAFIAGKRVRPSTVASTEN